MEQQCPRCGKHITVSEQELAIHAGNVVCPQCLHSFVVPGWQDKAAPSPHASQETPTAYSFCPECGHTLPHAAVKYCPYCGVLLPAEAPQVERATAAAPVAAAAVSQSSSSSQAGASRGSGKTSGKRESTSVAMPYMPYRFKTSQGLLGVRAPRASILTHIICITIILAELALFAFIIWKGVRL